MLIGVMTLWGGVFVLTKDVIDAVPPFTLAFLRVAIGFAVLLPIAWLRYRRLPESRSRLPWGPMFAMSFVGVAFYYAVFNLGLVYTSASQAALMQSSIPAITALVAILWLKEPASAVRMTGIALSVVGVLIIFSGSRVHDAAAASPVLGNAFVFVSVIAWGVYTSLARRQAQTDAIVMTAGVIGMGALMLLPAALIELRVHPMPQLTMKEWVEIFILGAGAAGLAYLFYNVALQDIDASQAGVFANLIPVVGVLSGIIVLGEPVSIRAILGGAVVMAGVWIAGSDRVRRPDAVAVNGQ